jgi:hypothetical protein
MAHFRISVTCQVDGRLFTQLELNRQGDMDTKFPVNAGVLCDESLRDFCAQVCDKNALGFDALLVENFEKRIDCFYGSR